MERVVNTKKDNLILIEGLETINIRRPITIIGLNVKQVRALQKGEKIKVSKSFYLNNKNIVKEVK